MIIQFEDLGLQFAQCFTTSFVGSETLSPNERSLIVNVAKKREKDFSTGRLCARLALGELGFPASEIMVGDNRQPIWPKGATGSISHSDKLAGAIVSREEDVRSLGLDIETIGGVKEQLWGNLFSQNERDFLNEFYGDQKDLYATVLFSMKEAFYKLQYPLTSMFLEFKDVELRYRDGKFSFHSTHPFTISLPLITLVSSQWIEFDGQIISVCQLNY